MLWACQLADGNMHRTASDGVCASMWFFLRLNERYKDKNSRNVSAYLKLFKCDISDHRDSEA